MQTYNFPPGLGQDAANGQHYLLIDSYKSLNAINRESKRESSIALYIPPNAMKTGFSGNYANEEGAALKAATRTGFQNARMPDLTSWEGAGDAAASAWGGMKSAWDGAGSGALGIGAKIADKAGFAGAMGIAVNNHMALVYKGPTEFRTHDFMFSFWPKDPSEADIVRGILNDFEQGMLPRVGGGQINSRRLSAPFFHAPRHYKLKFCKGGRSSGNVNPYLFQIKTSVITSMQVNHDPEGIVSFHSDGSPVHTTLTLSFKEIELVTSEDAVDAKLDTAVREVVKNQSQASAEKKRIETNLENFKKTGKQSQLML